MCYVFLSSKSEYEEGLDDYEIRQRESEKERERERAMVWYAFFMKVSRRFSQSKPINSST